VTSLQPDKEANYLIWAIRVHLGLIRVSILELMVSK
jgi:hypothetical protein